MARILAKNRSSDQKKLIKIRHTLDFYREELDSLEEKYNGIVEKKLDAFLVKGNKKLAKLAFEACDKEEFAQRLLEEKLQKYDIKAYKKQRAINHGAAKKIFKEVKAGNSFDHVLKERSEKRREKMCLPMLTPWASAPS